jgi:hypothetical protein
MSEKEKRIFHLIDGYQLPYKKEVALYDKGNNKVLAYKTIKWHFMKNRYFTKSKMIVVATITPNKIYTDDVHWAGRCLCLYLGLDCWPVYNKLVLRDILKHGKAAMDKYIAAQKEKQEFPIPKWDIEYYCEGDFAKFKERYLANNEFRDLFQQAAQLDKKIKLSWSDRKVHDVHMKWTEEIHKIKCRNCSTKPIWKIIPELPEGVELLNSEMRIAEEGQKMHHCIYVVYNSSLITRRCMAFHVNDFTVMFNVDRSGDVSFNQAYKAWNKPLSAEERKAAESLASIAFEIVCLNKDLPNPYRASDDLDELIFG